MKTITLVFSQGVQYKKHIYVPDDITEEELERLANKAYCDCNSAEAEITWKDEVFLDDYYEED